MKLHIISPLRTKNIAISWLELNTPEGNFVIQIGHAPMVLALSSPSTVTFCLTSGKQEVMPIAGGIAHIARTGATLIINE